MLRAIASLGIFAEDETNRFSLTPPAEFLRSDVPDSLCASIKFFGKDWHWQLWGDLNYSVETGKPAFNHLFGEGLYDYYQDFEVAKISSESKKSISGRAAASLLESYDYSFARLVVEVGVFAGYGTTLVPLLKANPTMKGVIFDFPPVIEAAKPAIEAQGLADRCELIAGNCLESMASGGDAYILMFVVHNWDDEGAVKLLKNCHQAMAENGKLTIIEMIMPKGNEPFVGKLVDLESLLSTPGGYERTEAQYRSILEAAGFKVTNIIPTKTANSIIEAVRA